MTLQEILGNELPRWAQISKDDPVIFTRLALFRNIKSTRFPSMLQGSEKAKAAGKLDEAVRYINVHGFGPFIPYSMESLNEEERNVLSEKGFLPEEGRLLDGNSRLYLNEDGSLAIRTNVHDHLAFLGFSGGNTVFSLWKRTARLADEASDILDYAFDKEFGYLTASPQFTGSGMKMVSLLFLPGFALHDRIGSLSEFLELRGFHLSPAAGACPSTFWKTPGLWASGKWTTCRSWIKSFRKLRKKRKNSGRTPSKARRKSFGTASGEPWAP